LYDQISNESFKCRIRDLSTDRGWHLCKDQRDENYKLKIVCTGCQDYNDKHLWEDEEWEYTFKMSPWRIRQGYRCPSCVKRSSRVRGQHYTDIVKSRGGVPVGPNQVRCQDGHVFNLRLSKLEEGDWCPFCKSTPKNRSINPEILENPKYHDTSNSDTIAMSDSDVDAILVIIICARYDEAEQTRKVFEHNGIIVRETTQDARLYHSSTMFDVKNRQINIEFHSIDKMGSVATATSALQMMITRRPSWLFMTGVCAGHPGKTHLGDVVIAQKTLDICAGKAGTNEFLHGGTRYEINPNLNNFIESIREKLQRDNLWKSLVPNQRPVSQRYKTDLMLKILYQHRRHCEDTERHHSSWIQYLLSFFVGSNPSRFGIPPLDILTCLNNHDVLCDDEEYSNLLHKLSRDLGVSVQQYNYNHIDKYYLNDQQYTDIGRLINNAKLAKPDPTSPSVIKGTLGTDLSTVRADLDTEKWVALAKEVADRDLLAIEMEAHGLYHATQAINDSDHQQTRPIVQTILVKGVSDLADPDKDDQFHTYGKQVSAVFVYMFLKEYGNTAARKLELGVSRSTNSRTELKKNSPNSFEIPVNPDPNPCSFVLTRHDLVCYATP
jgi:nucleoside phosphorylase